ncbi:MAG: dihydroorotase [Acidobacteria bacterium]|nr:dihydroorotase [Acidobacteriota bacterium]MCA1641059.1 dihydroorotase [Acidobacteriota bacterium]
MRLLIANGYLIDPTQGVNGGKDLFIEDGRVAGLLARGEGVPESAEVFDATGLVVAPGFIDLHTHLREPGQEYKETIETGASAAIAGGWTSVCAMPNTDPVNDNPAVTRFVIEQAEAAGLANVFPVGAITKNSEGRELAEMGEMKRAGVVAVSDDGRSVPSAGVMRRAMEYARGFDLTVVDHCEDRTLAGGGVMHEGSWSLRLGLRGSPALAEELDALRDCALAQLTGARLHLAHVSTRGALEAVRRAKERGLAVTCEVAPHHFTLSDEAVRDYDTNTKMCPPLRSLEHIEAILDALRDGTIDAIATDHAPHHADEKALEYDHAPNGITGLETAVGLAFDRLVHEGVVNLERLVELCSVNPAKIFSLADRGTLRPGARGDVTILDPDLEWTFDASRSKSKSRNTPFDGWTMRGAAVATVVGGRLVYRRAEESLATSY